MEKRYATQDVLTFKQAESLASKLVYSVEGISNCYLDGPSQQIVMELTREADTTVLDQTMERMIAWEKHHRILSHRIYRQSQMQRFDEERPLPVFPLESIFAGNGSVRRDIAVSLHEALDRLFAGLALNREARLRKYPSMIPLRILEKCRYISSFPQNIHLVSEIPHRLEALQKVKETDRLEDIARLSAFALSPAVCFHCYEELSGRRLHHPLVLTACGTCFRHEAPWRLGQHRLNEFSMREIVLFGGDAYVESMRKSLMDEAWTLFEALGLSGRIETASDPFYFSEDALKSQHQLMANMKYELIVNVGNGEESFSVASFNHMSDTLCKPFGIVDEADKPVHSGCVAFGVDRWVYALLATHGPDFDRWPHGAGKMLRDILHS